VPLQKEEPANECRARVIPLRTLRVERGPAEEDETADVVTSAGFYSRRPLMANQRLPFLKNDTSIIQSPLSVQGYGPFTVTGLGVETSKFWDILGKGTCKM
jgi:hypothetical protein